MWLEGSTVITPTVCSRARRSVQRAVIRLDLPTPGRAGDAERARPARVRVEQLEQPLRARVLVLGQRDRARDGTAVAGQDALGERVRVFLASPAHCRHRHWRLVDDRFRVTG